MNKLITSVVFMLCALVEGKSQPEVETFTRKFDAYHSLWKKARIHMVFNQDKFVPGDTAWFKTYFVMEDLTAVPGKQLIDLNLINHRGEVELNSMFVVEDGLGQNQFVIPDILPAGFYFVTAHSSWMTNFHPPNIFRKEITIVTQNSLMSDEKILLRATPEGGSLLRDVSNKVSILTNRPGSRVQLIDSDEKEIGRTTTDRSGTASVLFVPSQNESYFVRIVGDSATVSLPIPGNDGFSLAVTRPGREDPIKIHISSPRGSVVRDETHIIIVSSKDKIYLSRSFLQGDKAFIEFIIPQNDLPPGIAHVSLLTPEGRLLASRDFYNPTEDEVHVDIQASKPSYNTREKVDLNVLIRDRKGQPVSGEFSISVLNGELFESKKQNLINKVNIQNNSWKEFLVDRSDENWVSSLDNYLISFPEVVEWDKILSKEFSEPRIPFKTIVRKTGMAYLPGTLEPVPDHTKVMLYMQKNNFSYQTSTFGNGKLFVMIPAIYGKDEFFYLSETRNGKEIRDIKIMWENDEPVELPFARRARETKTADHYAAFVARKRLIYRAFHFFTSSGEIVPVNQNPSSDSFEDEIGGADITLKVADYKRYATMEELIKEVIPSAYHRKRRGKSIVRVKVSAPMLPATGDPLYVIDGILTKNTPFFLSLKPSDLVTVKIVTNPLSLQPLGLMGKNGIVIVQTKSGKTREPLYDDSRIYNGLSRALSFKVPDHTETNARHIPDFRTTVYWNPSVKTDDNGKSTITFFCSDDTGRLAIRIHGLARGTIPFSGAYEIEVHNPEKQ